MFAENIVYVHWIGMKEVPGWIKLEDLFELRNLQSVFTNFTLNFSTGFTK